MKSNHLNILIALVLVIILGYFFIKDTEENLDNKSNEVTYIDYTKCQLSEFPDAIRPSNPYYHPEKILSYEDYEYGISFNYPDSFVINKTTPFHLGEISKIPKNVLEKDDLIRYDFNDQNTSDRTNIRVSLNKYYSLENITESYKWTYTDENNKEITETLKILKSEPFYLRDIKGIINFTENQTRPEVPTIFIHIPIKAGLITIEAGVGYIHTTTDACKVLNSALNTLIETLEIK